MRRESRIWLFLLSATALFALMVSAVRAMPPFGHYRGPYGDVVNRITVHERHVTDVVTAVNFDFRAIDTLGEECILFLAVLGTTLLLRPQKKEEKSEKEAARSDKSGRRQVPLPSEATRVTTLGLVGPLVAFGIYIITHGQLTPGGGFQGGVILATAPLLVYLAGDLKSFKRISNQQLAELGEALGIGAFLCLGLPGMIVGTAYLQNVFPLGTTGDIISGGVMPLINLGTGLAVASGFVLLIHGFLEQTLELRLRGHK